MNIIVCMGLSYEEYNFDKRESEVSLIQGSREMDMQQLENEVEFWPVEHPMEPQDEDRPVKCPIPTSSSSLINDGRISEERCAESLRKRAVKKEGIVMVDAAAEPPRAVRKRHHTLTNGDHVIMPLTRRMPSLPHNVTIFQMLQQLDQELES